jgi:hypothetical protein
MIKTMICEVFSSSYGPEGCRGLVTEGSGADGPDVAGGVVRVAPFDDDTMDSWRYCSASSHDVPCWRS